MGKRPSRLHIRRAVCVLLGVLACFGCRRGAHPRITKDDVDRCERGLAVASQAPSMNEALHVMYLECVDVYAEPVCKDAFLVAGNLPFDRQLGFIVTECRKAYCPLFSSRKLQACRPDFVANHVSLITAWPEFHAAMLDHDGRGYAPRISKLLLAFQVSVRNLPIESPSSAPPATGATATPPASSGVQE